MAPHWAGPLLPGGAPLSPAGLPSVPFFNLLPQVTKSFSHGVLQPGSQMGVTGQPVEVALGAELCLARSLLTVVVASVSMVGGVREFGH